nr:MAG TPA: nuclease [Caudoviricetes sp.]
MSELSKLRKTLNMKNESDNNAYSGDSQASIDYIQEKLKNAGAGKYTDDRPDTVYSYSLSDIRREAAQKAAQESKEHMDNSSLDELRKERNSSRWDYAKTAVSTPFKQLKNKIVDKSDDKSAQIKAEFNNAKKAYYQADDIYNQKKEQEDERKNTEIAKIINDNQLSGLLDDVYTSQQIANADKNAISPDSLNAQKASQTRQLLENKLKSINTGEYNANDFINYYNAQKNFETTKKVTDKVSSFSEKHPVSTEIARVVTSPLGAVSNVHNSLNSIATTKPMGWTNFLTTARYGVKEGIEDRAADDNLIQLQGAHIGNILKVNDNNELEIMGNNFGNINSALYDNIDQSAEVVFDSLLLGGGITGGITKGAASLATQAGINALFSSSTMGDSIVQQLLNNTEAKEAYKSGLKDALINFGTEMAGGPLEWVGHEGNSTLGKILVSGFNEASEEVIGNWIDRISDELINGHSSEAQQAYQELINQGYSESEATKRVFKNMLAEDIFASLQAGLAGAAMTGSDIAAKSVSQAAAYYDEGKDLNQNPSVATDVVNRGLQSSTDGKAFQIASDLSENYNYDKQRFNNYKLGKLQELNSIEGGNSYLSEAVSNESNAEELSTIYNKAANGATINKREANAFVNSNFVKNIIAENNIEAKNNVELAKKAVSVISSIGASVNDIQTKAPTLSEQSKQAADNFKQKHFNQGTAVQTKQGEKVNITTIAQTGDSVLFNTTDNKIINANDINWNDEQREMLVNSAKAYSPNIAMNYINGYDSDNGTLSQYNSKFNTYLRLVGTEGYTAEDAAIKLSDMGMPLTDIEAARFEEAGKQFGRELNTIPQFKGQTKRVAPVQSKSVADNDYDRAYEKATDKKTAEKLTKILKGKTKKGTTDLTSGASDFEKLQMNVISKVAEDNNIQVVFVNNTETLGYGEKNGFRTPEGKIVLALNNQGGLMTAYFGHELCHDLEGTSAYSALESEVMKYLAKTYGDENLQKRIDGIMQSQNLSEQSAKAEIVANSCMTVFDENFITNFAKTHTKEARTIKDWFNRLVARIRQAMDKVKKYVTEYRAISDDVAEVERIRDLFNAALGERNANVKQNNANSNVRYSIKKTKNMQWKDQVNSYLENDGNVNRNDTLVVSKNIPDFLSKSNITDLPLAMPLSVLNKARKNNDVSHSLNKNDLLSLADDINNADIVVDDVTRKSLIFVKIKNNELKIIAAFSKNVYFDNDYVHKATTVHFRKNVNPMLEKLSASSTVFFKSKNEFDSLSRRNGIIPSAYNSKIKFIDEIVSNKTQKVKPSEHDKKVKFSVKQPVEETKDLIAIHNTTEEKLLSALELGGLPSPSIAIMKAENTRGNNDFGNISLVFDKSTIDPQADTANKVYSSDAYTPITVRAEHKLNEDKAWDVYSKIRELSKQKLAYNLNPTSFYPDNLKSSIDSAGGINELIDSYKNDYAFKELYLADTAEPIKNVVEKEIKTTVSKEDTDLFDYFNDTIGNVLDEIKSRPLIPSKIWVSDYDTQVVNAITDYFKELIPGISSENIENIFNNSDKFGTPMQRKQYAFAALRYLKNGSTTVKTEQDNEATHKLIDEKINQDKYEQWLYDLFDDVVEKKGISKGKDPYTEMGNRRSWESLYWDYNLENIVKAMNAQNAQGGNFLVSNIIGGSAYNYGSINEIRNDKSRLQSVDTEQYEKLRDNLYNRFREISQSMTKYDDPFAVADVIVEGIAKTKTKSGLANYLKTELKGWANYSDMAVDDIWSLVNDIRALPTEYFEAKPQRAVYFNEVYNAVIPDNSSETLKNALANAGINYSEYKAGDNDSRAEVLNSMDSIKFSDKVSNDDVFDDIFDIDDEDDIIALTEDLREMIKLSGQNARQISTSELSNAAEQIGLYKVFEADNAEAQNTAAALRKSYDSKYNKQLLSAQLSSLYEYMYNNSDIDYDYIWQRAKETAANIASGKNYVDDSVYRENLDVRKYIRGQVLKVPQNTINDFGAEEFIDFKKQARGKMRLSTEYGVSIDSLYKELHDMSEYYFPEVNEDGQSVVGNEQAELEQMLDFFEATQKVYHNGAEEEAEDSGMTIDQYTNVIATDILYRFTMIEPVVKSYESTQNEARMKELQSSYQSKMQDLENKYKEEYEERYNQILAESDAKIAELDKEIASLNDENNKIKKDVALAKRNATLKTKALAKQKAHAKEVSKNATERRKASNLRRKIGNVGNTLKSKLLNPTDNSYVPEYLINSIAEVCTQINKSQMYWKNGNEKKAKPYLESLIAQYESLRNDSDFDYRDEYDSEISLYLSELNKKIGNKQLSQLSANELNDIYEIVKSIKNSLIDATKQIGRDTAISNYQSRKKIINEVMNSQGMRNKVVGEYEFWTLNPMRFVRMMSDYDDNAELNRQFKELEKGQRKSYKVMYDLSNSLNKLQENKKEFKRFTHDKIETNLIDTNGNKVIMTPAQIAQVYMTAQRQQGLTHLMRGGINIYDIESLTKGKSGDGTVNKAVIVPHISVEDINVLYDLLTDYDKSWISAAKQTFEDSKSFINETSLVLKHRKLAKGNNYIPLEVDSEDRQNEISGLTFDATLEGNGALKAVNPNAGQRLIIRGLPMVLDKHISFVSSYAGLAIPIRNFKKIYGGTLSRKYDYNADNIYTVKAAINKKWTTSKDKIGTNLVEQAIADLESRREVDRAKLTSRIQSLWVQYTLAGNISVTLKQAASYPTAGAILSDYALKEAMKQEQAWKDTETLYNEIDSHTGIHYIRRLGLSVQEIAELSQDSNALVNKVPDKWQNVLPSNWIQAMDVRTTATLWIACKLEVEKNNPEIAKDSQAYWDKVTELYEDVIEYTQPNYDSLHRGEIQKNTNAALRMFNMFKTQTLQNAGLVYDSYGEWMYFRKKGDKEKANAAAKKFMRVAQTQTIAALILVAMTLFSNVVKHKLNKYRDDDDKITWLSILKACSNDVLATLFTTVLPIGASELQGFYDSAKNIWNGQRGFDIVQFPAVTALNDAITSVLDLIGFAKKFIDGKAKAEQFEKVAMNFLGTVGGISQIPVKNLYLILKGIIEWVKEFADN